MTSRGSDRDARPTAVTTIFLAFQSVVSVTSLSLLLLSLTERLYLGPTAEIVLAVIGFTAVYGIASVVVLRRIRRVQRFEFRIAITGQPAAGKTVFSVLAFDSLMNERVPGIHFTAESRSLIAVYQAIRNLPAGRWPTKTTTGNISTYEGEITAGRRRVSLEIGDSAGEYWLDFSDSSQRDPGFLEYVISANSIAHIIPLNELTKDGWEQRIARDVQELALAARLKQNARDQPDSTSLLIVLSKADLVISLEKLTDPRSGLFQIIRPFQLMDAPLLSGHSELYDQIQRLQSASARLEDTFSNVNFIVSSAPALVDGKIRVEEQSSDLIEWIVHAARQSNQGQRGILATLIGPQ